MAIFATYYLLIGVMAAYWVLMDSPTELPWSTVFMVLSVIALFWPLMLAATVSYRISEWRFNRRWRAQRERELRAKRPAVFRDRVSELADEVD